MAFEELNDKMLAIRETAKMYPNYFLIGGAIELVNDVFIPFAGLTGLLNLLDYFDIWAVPGYEWLTRTFGVSLTSTDKLIRMIVGFVVMAIGIVLKFALILFFALSDTNYATL